MDNTNLKDLEDLLDLTDSEGSSTSSSDNRIFKGQQPFVLPLLELNKDEPVDNPPSPEVKKRKKKGQLAPNKSHTSINSSSHSETDSIPPSVADEHAKEEFYDAHESYHTLPENQAGNNSTTAAAVVQDQLEQDSSPKITQEQITPTQAALAIKQPTTVTKPVTHPE